MTHPIILTVHLHSILQRKTPHGLEHRVQVELPKCGSLVDVLRILEIHLPVQELLFVVNGRMAEAGQPLADGDEVHIIPAISGG